ncbi:DUF2946 domain-containing protein [Rubrivivax gelatinosus]|uniref:DUF2946 domain-containing protein n=1 Tax=Rubrivivax gelatinosus TaxID=28068 RepID=UPI0018CB2E7A|nr:DUF2946 domain-containing protein [Rubrivivax gelatinosus]
MTLSKRGRHPFALWIAALVILMASLAPSVSQALGFARSAAAVEICTAHGSVWVDADTGGETGGPASAGHLFEHCPFCSLHAPALGLPPAPLALPGVPPGAEPVPRAFLAAARTPHAWVTAQPRAPPQA